MIFYAPIAICARLSDNQTIGNKYIPSQTQHDSYGTELTLPLEPL